MAAALCTTLYKKGSYQGLSVKTGLAGLSTGKHLLGPFQEEFTTAGTTDWGARGGKKKLPQNHGEASTFTQLKEHRKGRKGGVGRGGRWVIEGWRESKLRWQGTWEDPLIDSDLGGQSATVIIIGFWFGRGKGQIV